MKNDKKLTSIKKAAEKRLFLSIDIRYSNAVFMPGNGIAILTDAGRITLII